MSTLAIASEGGPVLTGTARIKATFRVAGRGLAIVLDEGWTGHIGDQFGVVRSKAGSSAYTGPEFVDGRSGSSLAVVATSPGAKDIFVPGDRVEFFDAGN